ncbi:General stress protein 39 [Pantoea sp. Nvir]|uniref:glucose 1-dehydrogenase n=1 Tax=unclassified Pantoea TaxID=2630326 RepID=UPI000CDCF581|nr:MULTISPECIES: glucose 1-dehydrogenase [unclassified Pantoea]MCG7365651.1 glucose 1-dehydrogenase [Pantoea sp. ACRSH]MCG7396132.1 glucose 1-dehydrogenase [Pantoea sp. ACRSC]POW55520.1 NAD(P)-dependent oxidoreductase [Pantoea alvi]
MTDRPQNPHQAQQQTWPGSFLKMDPKPDHGETSYQGSGRLKGKTAIITGGDSGIGRAVAIAYAREGADVVISYLDEHEDAKDTAKLVEEAGQQALLIAGDVTEAAHCRSIVAQTAERFGKIDIVVNNAAFQMTRTSLEEIGDDEFDRTMKTNLYAMFYICKAAVPHMPAGGSIINTASINADQPKPKLLAYSATKAAIVNFSGGLAALLAEKGIRANAVAPGPIWTPLIPATMPPEQVESFGSEVPLERMGQPAELAPAYVMLASDEGSYISGATIAVTGGVAVI